MTADRRIDQVRRTLEGLLGAPASEGNRLDVLRNGDEIFPAMLGAIEASTRTIDFLTFIYWTGDIGRRFATSLADRARAGVRVRVLLDAIGARKMDDELVELMEDAGCDVRWFRPVKKGDLGEVDHRTHRKILICDETTAFTGGVGIADEWTGDARDADEWRDTHFLLQGPAVLGLRGAFVDNWAETGANLFDPDVDRFPRLEPAGTRTIQVVKGAAETGWSDIATMFRSLVLLAERRLRITTAYFNPDDLLRELICDTARRGVTVQVLLPGPHADKRFVQVAGESAYGELLDAGVEIHTYQTSMLHAKVLTIDGIVASVGSANVNNRSSLFDEEVNLIVYDEEITAVLDAHFDDDLAASVAIDPERWSDRGPVQRALEAVVDTAKGLI